MRLEKYHGLGNDFLVLLDLDDRQPVDEATVRALCDRHRGVGADGLMRVTAGPTMELWNADGSRAEMSGNGIRCLVLALVDAGLVPGPEVKVATEAGMRRVTVEGDGRLSVDMGPAQFRIDRFGRGTGVAALVDMGNPHAVVEVQDPYDHDLAREARAYPGLNLELVAAGPGPDELTMRVWERGVGETQACGTGACAAAVAGRGWGIVGDKVTVHQPGGDLLVDLTGDTILLTGPAEHVCSIHVPGDVEVTR